MLTTPGGFTALMELMESRREFGVIAAASTWTGNRNQMPKAGGALREDPRMVCFVAVAIPRRVLDIVGPMDERFGGFNEKGERIYGHCDDDMCLRIRRAGFKVGIFDGCVVDHSTLKSTFRSVPCPLEPGRKLFIEKWGSHPL
jgi:GT2 family glycosyltransferase